jgi:hypothetical protein
MTAQETYAAMLRGQIAPRLRALGFQGSGAVYRLPDAAVWRQIGFQRSRSSTAAVVRFTINLTRADKARWEAARVRDPWIGARPSGSTRYALPPEVHQAVRIGQLMPGPGDIWWEVVAGQDTTTLAEAVVGAIERYAVAWLRGSTGSAA